MFRFAGSVLLRGGRGAAGRYRWPVWGALAEFRPHWVRPAHGCVLSPSMLLRLPPALYRAGPALCGCVRVVPVFQYSTKVRTRLPLRFVPSPAARSLMGTLSPGAVHLLPSVAPASVSVCTVGCMRLVFSRDPPGGCRPSRISGSLLVRNWRPVCSVVGGAISGAEFAPFPSPLPPASGGDGPVCSRLAPPDLLSPFVLRAASSVFRQVNFLSLFCYPTV